MAITKVSRGLLSTGIVDNSNATAITIDSSENVTLAGTLDVSGEIDISSTDDLRLRFYDGSTFKAGLQVATSADDMIAGSADGDFAIRTQGNMLLSAGGNNDMLRIDGTHGIVYFDGYSGGDGITILQDQALGYTNNLQAGGFGILHRESYDCYILGNSYYYKTGGTATYKIKTAGHGATVIGMARQGANKGLITFSSSDTATTSANDNITFNRICSMDSDGLKFGTDSAAANALDDYEEGTWTPKFGDNSTTASDGGQFIATYVKIGKLVTVSVDITTVAYSGANSHLMYGLPYAGGGSGVGNGGGSIGYTTTANIIPGLHVTGATTAIYFTDLGTATGGQTLSISSKRFIFSLTYETTT